MHALICYKEQTMTKRRPKERHFGSYNPTWGWIAEMFMSVAEKVTQNARVWMQGLEPYLLLRVAMLTPLLPSLHQRLPVKAIVVFLARFTCSHLHLLNVKAQVGR